MDVTPYTHRLTDYQWLEIFTDNRQDIKRIYKENIVGAKKWLDWLSRTEVTLRQEPDFNKQFMLDLALGWISNRRNETVQNIKKWQHLINQINNWGKPVDNNKITLAHIAQAKQYPVHELYQGKLKHYGARYTGQCPFHDDRSPSFVIYPNNTWNCFAGCGHGDAIDFVSRIRGISFLDAVRWLINN